MQPSHFAGSEHCFTSYDFIYRFPFFVHLLIRSILPSRLLGNGLYCFLISHFYIHFCAKNRSLLFSFRMTDSEQFY